MITTGIWRKWFQPRGQFIGFSLVSLVLVAIVPLLVFGSGAAWVIISQKREAIEGELRHTTRALQVAADNELLHQFDAMQLLASDASLDAGALDNFREKVQRALVANSEWVNVALIDPKSNLIVFSGLPMIGAANLTSSGAEVDEVTRTRKGKIVGLLPAGSITHQPIVQFLLPVVRGNDVRFILSVVTYPKSLSDLFAAQRMPPSWTGAVIDSRVMIAGRSRDPQKYVGVRATPTLANRIAASDTGMFTALNQEGDTVYTVFSRSPFTGWSVVIGIPAGEIEGPIQRTLMLMGLAGTALIVFALILAALVGRAIVLQRKAYDTTLQESQSKLQCALTEFKELVAQIPVGVYKLRMSKDGASHFDYVSPRFCEQMGSTQDRVQSDPDSVFRSVAPQDLPELIRLNEVARETLQPFSWEGRVIGPQGERWMHAESTATLLPEGDILWNGMQFDLTERKKAQDELIETVQELRQSEKQMSETQRIGSTGSWVYNLGTGFIWGSDEGLRIFGYPPFARELSIDEIEACIPERERVHQALIDLIDEGRAYDVEYAINPADGSPSRLIHAVAKLEKDTQGNPLKVFGFIQDITERRQLEDEVRQMAFHDALTDLPNRRLLLDRLTQVMASSKRTGRYAAIVFLDLDNFKPLNDTRGHDVGDLLLIEAAARLTNCVREIDTVARFGGDEFVVMLSDLNADREESRLQAHAIAEKIRATLSEPYHLTIRHSGKPDVTVTHHCTVSIGVALFSDHEDTGEDILKCADAAMYQAKDEGRNTIRFHEAESQS